MGISATKASPSRTILILCIAILLVLLGAGVYYVLGKSATQSALVKEISPVTPTPKKSFSSLKQALAKSMSLRCDYSDENGKKVLAYIKAGSVRADISGAGAMGNSSVIIKDNNMYFWTGKQGFVTSFDREGVMNGTASASPSQKTLPSTPIGSLEDLEKYKEYCNVASVDDQPFVLPADVQFLDMSKMMPNGMMIPGAPGISDVLSPEQMKMMQKSPSN